ncbi:G-protein beta WD-40 repeats containing protein [Reticulomyxa filosa]|uniref:G-protein beta WD-40 repeats containing protein n=1 Tax=Reticulomyxa filosa TaxID=46433 RepID=X6LWR9_RETFI|nr:G-protein beta WD-40 repeats containing protein [Reticulomyxa filosa]|eukprot:ETO05806.1 G-protein beta WD-40 repeats containing protein [Reticulomyxa filosa]
MLDTFRLSAKLLKTFIGHAHRVNSIAYPAFDGGQFLCSGSHDKTVRVWDMDTTEQIQLFDGHSSYVYCVKFSPYHYHKHHRHVICSSSNDKTIRFWDIKHNRQLERFNKHIWGISGIEFSPFNCGQYLCSASYDRTIRLWDIETSNSLHVFNGHEDYIFCVDFSPLQSNNNCNEKSNGIGVIGGNGYTICSGSFDKSIRIWDIETAKKLLSLKGHTDSVMSVKYGSNKLGINGVANTILSGSMDKSVRLWDIRSGQQIQLFTGHTSWAMAVEYSPFEVNDDKVGGNSNVICSGSLDNTVCFWDIRSNKGLYVIKGSDERDSGEVDGIYCLEFLPLKRKSKNSGDRGVLFVFGGSIIFPTIKTFFGYLFFFFLNEIYFTYFSHFLNVLLVYWSNFCMRYHIRSKKIFATYALS